ncbi:MAG: Tm-1-like ATP-binding domain-containing protein [Deltaproteobacteria bacterium]|nr:Tm-1-like ATP-binding domain-containing protein [Deltaproteobacteria bacterium]
MASSRLEDAGNRFPGRAYHAHNAAITALSTPDQEMALLSKHPAQPCNKAKGAYRYWFPIGGLSDFDSEGGLWNPQGRREISYFSPAFVITAAAKTLASSRSASSG